MVYHACRESKSHFVVVSTRVLAKWVILTLEQNDSSLDQGALCL